MGWSSWWRWRRSYSETQGQCVCPWLTTQKRKNWSLSQTASGRGGNTTLWMTGCWFSNSHQAYLLLSSPLFNAHVHVYGDFLEWREVWCSMHELKMEEKMTVHGKYTLGQTETCLWCCSEPLWSLLLIKIIILVSIVYLMTPHGRRYALITWDVMFCFVFVPHSFALHCRHDDFLG